MTATHPEYLAHLRAERCGFCHHLANIYAAGLDADAEWAAIEALFDRADRASRARRLYGQRKGHR